MNNINPLYQLRENSDLARKAVHMAAKDKGIIGKTLRTLNGAGEIGKAAAVTLTPPMPSMDERALKSAATGIKAAIKDDPKTRLKAATRLGRTLKHPFKTLYRFGTRTGIDFMDQGATYIPGGFAGVTPTFRGQFALAGTTPTNFLKQSADYYKTAGKHYYDSVRDTLGKIKNYFSKPQLNMQA